MTRPLHLVLYYNYIYNDVYNYTLLIILNSKITNESAPVNKSLKGAF